MINLHNAQILGADSFSKIAEAMAVQEGTIIALGKNEDVLSLNNLNTSLINMHGKTILPGLTDSHIHLQHLGKSLTMVNCETNSIQECYFRIVEKVKTTKPGEWILGHGWNQNLWSGGFEDIDLLNQISSKHPIYLTAKSLHASWANTKALEIAGINHSTVDPVDGLIGRNQDGSPNGLLLENAMGLVDDFVPPIKGQKLVDVLNHTQRELWKAGITAVHDFDGADCFSALQELDAQDKLRIRTIKSIPLSNLETAIQTGLRSGFGSDYLRIGSVKLFADGALGTQTAAMLKSYENDIDNFGILMLTKDEITQYGKIATQNGLSLAIHAIGDKANREVIDAYIQIRNYERDNRLPILNHRIEHIQVLANDDIERLAKNHIIASMQPIHLISDMDTADRFWGTRSKYAYAFNSLLQAGSRLIFGSDSPVESFNPFYGIYAALTRQKFDQTPKTGWFPEEKLALEKILSAYTINPAVASCWDKKIGSLDIGKKADLIVLPVNPFEISPNEIRDLMPDATMVSGQWVWQGNEF